MHPNSKFFQSDVIESRSVDCFGSRVTTKDFATFAAGRRSTKIIISVRLFKWGSKKHGLFQVILIIYAVASLFFGYCAEE